ncbi:hypothetical protein IJG29_04555 [Candidatus Saccharibacteria bacterium]|nr:hypothetical protein [Candidatus Saccharibacteria bacterium]
MDNAGVNIIRGMTRDEFYQNIVKGVAKTSEFSALVVAGPARLLDSERNTLRKQLAEAGIPYDATVTDEDLIDIAVVIAGRSVTLR